MIQQHHSCRSWWWCRGLNVDTMKRFALHQDLKRAGDVSLLIRPLILQLSVIYSSNPVGSLLCWCLCGTAAESTTALPLCSHSWRQSALRHANTQD